MQIKREFSAGCIVYKKTQSEKRKAKNYLFLLGKHSGYHKWVLPKGLIEDEEKGVETAARETEEEMGVKCRVLDTRPIHVERYFFWADYKKNKTQGRRRKGQSEKQDQDIRRVERYEESGGKKIKVFKTVAFYLAEYVSGGPEDHDWEMEEAGWFGYEEALEKMAFKGEKEALKKALEKIKEKERQPSLFL